MTEKRRPLARGLTSRLVVWQVLMLALFAMSVPLIEFAFGGRSLVEPDPTISDEISEALYVADGALALRPTSKFRRLESSAPALWFVVVSQTGLSLRYGDVPDSLAPLVDTLGALDASELRDEGYRYLDALVRLEDSPVGEVTVLFGNGPAMGPLKTLVRYAVGDILPLLVLILMVLGTTTLFVIPRLIGNSMAGLRRAVSHAEAIDLDKPGTRLPTADVPAEIAALVDAMNAALSRIDEGHERHQRFLADAAHELRTPIAILQNRIELLAQGEAGNQLMLDVQRLANLAEQLLDLQRMDNQRTDLRPVDLVAVAKNVISDLAPLAVNAGYEPQFAAEADTVPVVGDSSAIERALINVVQNAIAYGGNRGRIIIAVTSSRTIEISDDGDGIRPADRDRIFEAFHRLKPIDRGAGLGLNLVREIMKHHQGTVSVSESVSGGARFVLRFPDAATEVHPAKKSPNHKPPT